MKIREKPEMGKLRWWAKGLRRKKTKKPTGCLTLSLPQSLTTPGLLSYRVFLFLAFQDILIFLLSFKPFLSPSSQYPNVPLESHLQSFSPLIPCLSIAASDSRVPLSLDHSNYYFSPDVTQEHKYAISLQTQLVENPATETSPDPLPGSAPFPGPLFCSQPIIHTIFTPKSLGEFWVPHFPSQPIYCQQVVLNLWLSPNITPPLQFFISFHSLS